MSIAEIFHNLYSHQLKEGTNHLTIILSDKHTNTVQMIEHNLYIVSIQYNAAVKGTRREIERDGESYTNRHLYDFRHQIYIGEKYQSVKI